MTLSPRITRLGVVAYLTALAAVIVDQLTKFWVLGPFDLPDKGIVDVTPVFRLSMVWNPGVSYGLLAAHGPLGRWGLVAFAAAVVVALGVWASRMTRPLTAVAVGLIMGGAIGNNIIDRVRWGAVADFIDFSKLHFIWVFNVADSAITVGVILLILEAVLTSRAPSAPVAPS